MARIHSIEIFYASSNPALGKILLKFSDGEGGILTKSVKGRFFWGFVEWILIVCLVPFDPYIWWNLLRRRQVLIPHMRTESKRDETLFLKMSMKDEQFLSNEQQKWAPFFSDEQPRWALFKRWATKMSTFFSDEQPRWALFSRWATEMSTFSSNEQPRWGAS